MGECGQPVEYLRAVQVEKKAPNLAAAASEVDARAAAQGCEPVHFS